MSSLKYADFIADYFVEKEIIPEAAQGNHPKGLAFRVIDWIAHSKGRMLEEAIDEGVECSEEFFCDFGVSLADPVVDIREVFRKDLRGERI